MGRAKGGDVVIELMDAVAKLQEESAHQRMRLEVLVESQRDYEREMGRFRARVDELSTAVGGLEARTKALTTGFEGLAAGARRQDELLSRTAELIAALAGTTRSRIENHEKRLLKLESAG